MKKFIKKTLAGLIAGVMAVSSMPFVALAADTTALDEAETALNSFVYTNPTGDYGSLTGDKTSDFSSGTNYTTYMRNVLYGEKGAGDDQGKTTSGTVSATIHYPQMVLLYDGTNELDTPVLALAMSTGQDRYTYAAVNNNSNLKYTNETIWYGTDQSDNWTLLYSTSHDDDIGALGAVTTAGKAPQISKKKIIGIIGWNNIWYRWANMFRFNGSFATDEYTKSVTPSVTFYSGSNDTMTTTDIVNNCNATKPLYYINYKAVLDKIDTAKSDITSVSYDKYTEDSVNAYANAVKALTSFNPATDLTFSASSLENDVNDAGTKIKELVDNYDSAKAGLTLKTYTYSFVNAEGTIVNTVEATSVEEALKSAPTNTATKYDYVDNTKHKTKTYAWQEASAVTDTTINEVESVVEEAHTIDANTHKCTLCGGYALDTSAYDTALKEVKAIAKNEDQEYTDDSINALNQVIASVEEERTKVTTQEELDTLTKILRESVYDLAIAKNTVTFYTVAAGSSVPTEVESKTLDYGTTYTANANANVKQWTVTTDESHTSTKLNTFDSSVNVIVTKDVSIYAYLSDEDTSVTSSKVTFLGKNNQVVAIKYVAQGEELKTNTVDIPEIPFYSAGTWSEESITGDGNEYTVKASYTYLLGATNCQVNLVENGKITWTKDYSYDSYVYLSKADKSKKYALYSDEACTKLLTYIDGVDFYAPKTAAVYVKEYTEEAQPTVAVTGSFSTSTSTKKYANFNCKFFLPADATAVEWGLEVKIGDGVFAKVKAESKSERNEYTVKLGTGIDSGTNSIEGRAYLVYEYNGVTYTINSGDLTTVTLS